ncbi:hypothetical protein TorRG33x02_270090 [Trema orientale]|uniref:Uncharacterized protein n=1 Tax=Trema orientale TaxID=63057 RepID=A0A2P5CX63_TREOI|nr:hypothetical protein TorRG33x02_270090 [Trema orientale]
MCKLLDIVWIAWRPALLDYILLKTLSFSSRSLLRALGFRIRGLRPSQVQVQGLMPPELPLVWGSGKICAE